MVRFVEMSRQEARAYLQRFLAETPPRLEALRAQCSGTGGPTDLDLTPASLEPLWSWAAPRLSYRAGYQPVPPGQPGGHVPPELLEPEDQLPSWFDPEVPGWPQWSAESLWLLDGLARYLGETLVGSVRGARWTLGHARRKGYVYQNHPVITGLPTDDSEPMVSVAVLALKVMHPMPGPRTLADLYRAWTTG